jgi:3-oxoacyl-(acyl-carrier-protein) synthase
MNLAITGTGAVSPAGWGVQAMMDSLNSAEPISATLLERQCDDRLVQTQVLRVPAAQTAHPKFARLRRTSPISKFAAAAVMEALGETRLAAISGGDLRVGVIFTLLNGCVNYSNRFFGEVLSEPAMASPILFPETVFNAPSSHLSAMIGSQAPNDTLIGDGSGFFTGMDLAAEWIMRGEVDGCLIVASEEVDWLSAEGLCLYSKRYQPAEGAGAIYLEATDGPVKLRHLPDPVSYSHCTRAAAAAEIRKRLSPIDDGHTLLIDSRGGIARYDQPETLAWQNWNGPRWSPKILLGEAMGASSALQIVAAAEALKSGHFRSAIVTASGANQQAAGVLLSAR